MENLQVPKGSKLHRDPRQIGISHLPIRKTPETACYRGQKEAVAMAFAVGEIRLMKKEFSNFEDFIENCFLRKSKIFLS